MIFPFEISKRYPLSNEVFGNYSTSEIIDKIYEYLYKEEFTSIVKNNNEIELIGNKDKWLRHMNWSKTDRITHCIDSGKIKIIDSSVERTLIYTYQIKNFVLSGIPELIAIPLFFGLIFWSLRVGLTFFWLILAFEVAFWVFLLVVHPWTIEAPIEIIRINSIRDKIKNRK
jgi:hypothetical protein